MIKLEYNCTSCGHTGGLIERGSEFNKSCLNCGGKITRYKMRFGYKPHMQFDVENGIDGLMKENERWSWAMAVNPENIEKAMKQYPGSTYNSKGQLRIKSRAHKLMEMRRRGMEEWN